MTISEFVAKYPRLYHMASPSALEQIKKYGLLSTEATLDLLQIPEARRQQLTRERRPECLTLSDVNHGIFILRDQKPLRDIALDGCLKVCTREEFYKILNERSFLWASKERVETLLNARAYRYQEQLVLTIDTAEMMKDHGGDIELSSINSGATLYDKPPKRGPNTFVKLAEYEKFNGKRPVVEVTVKGSIPNLKNYLLSCEVRKAQEK